MYRPRSKKPRSCTSSGLRLLRTGAGRMLSALADAALLRGTFAFAVGDGFDLNIDRFCLFAELLQSCIVHCSLLFADVERVVVEGAGERFGERPPRGRLWL